jgi:hypothetical protein
MTFISPRPINYRDYPYGRGLWQIVGGWAFEWQDHTHLIPDGFVLDFYSIPSMFRWWRQPNRGYGNEPAAIHDYLVRHRKTLRLSLMECHDAFDEAMRVCKFSSSERRKKYWAVVLVNWAIAGPGDGTPGKQVRRAMAREAKAKALPLLQN